MTDRTTSVDLLQGTLATLILKSLSWGPLHGYGIARWIEQITDDELLVEEGSLYPALHRLERERSVSSEWKVSENKQRVKVYRLTPHGRRRLAEERSRWDRLIEAMAGVLAGAGSEAQA